MPDFVPIASDIQVRVQATHTSGKKMFNVFHTDCGSLTPTLAEVTAAVDAVRSWCDASYKSLFSNSLRITEIRGRSMAQEPGPEFVEGNLSIVGSLSSDNLPLSTTQCVNTHTGLTGYSHRGRWFVFTATEAETTAGLFTSAYVAACEVSLDVLIADIDAIGQVLSVESRRHLVLFAITGGTGNVIPAHLRSRRVDKGI